MYNNYNYGHLLDLTNPIISHFNSIIYLWNAGRQGTVAIAPRDPFTNKTKYQIQNVQ